MGELSIKVNIAGRTYPLTINMVEEEQVRKATKLINEHIKEFEEKYAVRDKQDLLAMCALQLQTQNLDFLNKTVIEDDGLEGRLTEIESFVSDYLSKI